MKPLAPPLSMLALLALLLAEPHANEANGTDGVVPREVKLQIGVQPIRLARDDGSDPVPFEGRFSFEVTKQIFALADVELLVADPVTVKSSKYRSMTITELTTLTEGKDPEFEAKLGAIPRTRLLVFAAADFPGSSGEDEPYHGFGKQNGRRGVVKFRNSSTDRKSPGFGGLLIAHEMGHNLNLTHVSDWGNLMNQEIPAWFDDRRILTEFQKCTLRLRAVTSGIARALPGPIEIGYASGSNGRVAELRFSNLLPRTWYSIYRSDDLRRWRRVGAFVAVRSTHTWTPPANSPKSGYFYYETGL